MAKKGQGKPGAGRPSSAVPGVKKAISKNTHAAKKTKKAPAVHADPQQQAPITKDKRKSFKRAALHKKKNKKQRKEGAQPGVEPAATAALPPPSPAAAGRQRAAVSKKRKQEQPAAAEPASAPPRAGKKSAAFKAGGVKKVKKAAKKTDQAPASAAEAARQAAAAALAGLGPAAPTAQAKPRPRLGVRVGQKSKVKVQPAVQQKQREQQQDEKKKKKKKKKQGALQVCQAQQPAADQLPAGEQRVKTKKRKLQPPAAAAAAAAAEAAPSAAAAAAAAATQQQDRPKRPKKVLVVKRAAGSSPGARTRAAAAAAAGAAGKPAVAAAATPDEQLKPAKRRKLAAGTPGASKRPAEQLEAGRVLYCFDTNVMLQPREGGVAEAWAAIEAGGGGVVQAVVALKVLQEVRSAKVLKKAGAAGGYQLLKSMMGNHRCCRVQREDEQYRPHPLKVGAQKGDDSILDALLYFASLGAQVVLVTQDRAFTQRALEHDIPSLHPQQLPRVLQASLSGPGAAAGGASGGPSAAAARPDAAAGAGPEASASAPAPWSALLSRELALLLMTPGYQRAVLGTCLPPLSRDVFAALAGRLQQPLERVLLAATQLLAGALMAPAAAAYGYGMAAGAPHAGTAAAQRPAYAPPPQAQFGMPAAWPSGAGAGAGAGIGGSPYQQQQAAAMAGWRWPAMPAGSPLHPQPIQLVAPARPPSSWQFPPGPTLPPPGAPQAQASAGTGISAGAPPPAPPSSPPWGGFFWERQPAPAHVQQQQQQPEPPPNLPPQQQQQQQQQPEPPTNPPPQQQQQQQQPEPPPNPPPQQQVQQEEQQDGQEGRRRSGRAGSSPPGNAAPALEAATEADEMQPATEAAESMHVEANAQAEAESEEEEEEEEEGDEEQERLLSLVRPLVLGAMCALPGRRGTLRQVQAAILGGPHLRGWLSCKLCRREGGVSRWRAAARTLLRRPSVARRDGSVPQGGQAGEAVYRLAPFALHLDW